MSCGYGEIDTKIFVGFFVNCGLGFQCVFQIWESPMSNCDFCSSCGESSQRLDSGLCRDCMLMEDYRDEVDHIAQLNRDDLRVAVVPCCSLCGCDIPQEAWGMSDYCSLECTNIHASGRY